ncbi:23S rRNA pseudouridine(2604) synthase RluF [Marinicella sp. S1101]|uniref:23S rRNA pseudouridine(2604) synthase RluF n=1 Tax=Marinicella marina TaxID=2996016 RepID=UPI002260BF32|nr:23S rRNA pseudouridine(2604) synthase RluF [Marinicella marina]MCX7552350.1 23S rRNA pseudouridine(2604) synthase RluF [Marinicella marina]MDJ1139225.1 23S rRNA pseudouridine(2604) synthase RluF [Marinicella marina]
MRINKYICSTGLYSRKAADGLVKDGVVFIAGRQAVLGDLVAVGDEVIVNGRWIEPLTDDQVIVIALNKPVGVVCTAAEAVQGNIIDYVGHHSRIFPIGRLDKDSQGLIFLTNKADLADKILGVGNHHEKEYRVTVNKEITDGFIAKMSSGVSILGKVTQTCQVVKESAFVFRITLMQGLNRQIRRMCQHHNYRVKKLERIRIMHINLDGIALGEWRDLTDDEFSELIQSI